MEKMKYQYIVTTTNNDEWVFYSNNGEDIVLNYFSTCDWITVKNKRTNMSASVQCKNVVSIRLVNDQSTKKEDLKRYTCTSCNWVYDPNVGDPDSGIAPGTKFSDIPDNWDCPICGCSSDVFEECE